MHVLISSMIDDPFDPPGYGRFGGGHLFLFDLGRYLVRRGFQITYLVRKNSLNKQSFEKLGDTCSIIRLDIGPPTEITPDEVANWIKPLQSEFSKIISDKELCPSVVHTSYWISGIVALPFTQLHRIKHVHSILSLGRLKDQTKNKISALRDKKEVELFTKVDDLIAVCPDEIKSLNALYPEVKNNNCHIVPYGINETIYFPRPESADYYFRRSSDRFQQGS